MKKNIPFDKDPLDISSALIDKKIYSSYFLYESENEFSIAFNAIAEIKARPDEVIVQRDQVQDVYPVNVLHEALDQALNSLDIDGWRLYGIANYSLARYNYDLNIGIENDNLLQLIIPESEIRISESEILIRSVDQGQLSIMEKALKEVIDEEASDLKKRVKANLTPCPEVKECNADIYKDIVGRAIKSIHNKDFNKIVLSRKIDVPFSLDLPATYLSGRRQNTPKRSYVIDMADHRVVGFSPETVVEIDSEGWVTTLPLAGTRDVGNSEVEKEQLKMELLSSTKEITEHVSTTKMTYEEMKRICLPESVSVYDFLTVADRGTVQHLTSRVVGKSEDSASPWKVFNSLFPAATSSGAPKKTAIETIGQLETERRDLYGGCVLTLDQSGTFDSALVLRTAFESDGKTWMQAGAGIGPLCTPDFELNETFHKISSISQYLVKDITK